jgi:hypothetical protein
LTILFHRVLNDEYSSNRSFYTTIKTSRLKGLHAVKRTFYVTWVIINHKGDESLLATEVGNVVGEIQ